MLRSPLRGRGAPLRQHGAATSRRRSRARPIVSQRLIPLQMLPESHGTQSMPKGLGHGLARRIHPHLGGWAVALHRSGSAGRTPHYPVYRSHHLHRRVLPDVLAGVALRDPRHRAEHAPGRLAGQRRTVIGTTRAATSARDAYFGCTLGSPPGVPGGGMTLSRPPSGGATCISRSTPAGGQMMPFDCASLSLNGCEPPPPPTVGGSPLTSGGQAASDRKSTRLNSSHLGISYAV